PSSIASSPVTQSLTLSPFRTLLFGTLTSLLSIYLKLFILLAHSFSTIIMGDFNLPHLLSDPPRELSSRDILVSASYFDRAIDLDCSLLNVLRIFIQFLFDSSSHLGILDISFANSAVSSFF